MDGSSSFLGFFGFSANPFEDTNADDEEKLSEYFIYPPYFSTVFGDVKKPRSCIVFAPRGSGKSAQKVMIEHISDRKIDPFLCIVYDDFHSVPSSSIDDLNASWHLEQIIKKIVVSVIYEHCSEDSQNQLSTGSLEFLSDLVMKIFSDDDEKELQSAIDSIRNNKQKALAFFSSNQNSLLNIVNVISSFTGGDKIHNFSSSQLDQSKLHFYLKKLSRICKELGFNSIYVLVDRVDEHPSTNGRGDICFNIVAPLITNLYIVETEGVAFKFFLWDGIKHHLTESGAARPDRINTFEIMWNADELSQMLTKRLTIFSDSKVKSFNNLLSRKAIDVHTIIAHFAFGSPRDMVRICQTIVQEQTKLGDDPGLIDWQTVERAIRQFSSSRVSELYLGFSSFFARIKKLEFSVEEISALPNQSSKFDVQQEVDNWINRGALARVSIHSDSSEQTIYRYRINDPRLALHLQPLDRTFISTMNRNLMVCSHCKHLNSCHDHADSNAILSGQLDFERCVQCSAALSYEHSLGALMRKV